MKLVELLKASKADDYLIRTTTTTSSEAFFIGQKLDMNRSKEVTHTMLTVYMDSEDGKFRGSASKEIHPSMNEEEMKASIDSLIYAASFVKNPMFPLVCDVQEEVSYEPIDIHAQLVKLTKAMQAVQTKENEKVNSYEIFVNQQKKTIINSKGVQVSFGAVECEIEVVINVNEEGHEIELLKDMRFADKPAEEITKEVEDLFKNGHDRLKAQPTKANQDMTVLLTGDDVPQFFGYFLSHANASSVFMGISRAKLGEKMTGEDADDLTIKGVADLKGSSRNVPYDTDGNPVKDITLFEKGVCKSYYGSLQHASYIQLDNTTSIFNFTVDAGSVSVEDMKKEPYLEIKDFSAFVLDPVAGNFGGEIRLGYYYDGEKTVPVTGGSLSANFSEVLKTIKFSKETRQMNSAIVPCAIQLKHTSISGE